MDYDGTGLVCFDYLVTFILWCAVVMQIAVSLDHTIEETRQAEACRWLVAGGVAALALRMTFILYDVGDIKMPPITLAALGVMGLGLFGHPLDRLMHPREQRRCTDQRSGMA